jgi:hypothetical protein
MLLKKRHMFECGCMKNKARFVMSEKVAEQIRILNAAQNAGRGLRLRSPGQSTLEREQSALGRFKQNEPSWGNPSQSQRKRRPNGPARARHKNPFLPEFVDHLR